MARNRNKELEIDPDAGFDYEAFDDEVHPTDDFIEEENPYEDYELFDIEVVETVKKKFTVYAKDKESAKQYFDDVWLRGVDMEKGIDEYKRESSVCEWCGSSAADYTVPAELYEDEDEDE